jgi:hypothetical protein
MFGEVMLLEVSLILFLCEIGHQVTSTSMGLCFPSRASNVEGWIEKIERLNRASALNEAELEACTDAIGC